MKIIGNGLIANKFSNCKIDDVLIFASGVSNSSEILDSEFQRERLLLLKAIKNNSENKIVYFSSCGVIDRNNNNIAYYKHKLNMEKIVKKSKNYLILRLPQLLSGLDDTKNKNTIINNFVEKILCNEIVRIQINASRYVIDINDVVLFINNYHHLYSNRILNFANPVNYKVEVIFKTIATVLKVNEPFYEIVNGGSSYELELEYLSSIDPSGLVFNFGYNYLHNCLKRSYENNKQVK
jgi:nucleoside-diphosphate-sugar epimerase